MLRFYISIKNNLIIDIIIKKLLWSQNRAHFVEFGVNRLYQRHAFGVLLGWDLKDMR